MQLNDYGQIVQIEWLRTVDVRIHAEMDAFVVMPNHIHGIIVVAETVGATRRVAPTHRIVSAKRLNAVTKHPNGPTSGSIGAITRTI